MNKIQTTDDIRKWAEEIVAAKGEKFTPLSKGDQYKIARFILGLGECEKPMAVNEVQNDQPQEVQTAPHETTQQNSQDESKPKPCEDNGESVKMTRGAAMHLAGHSAQKAFDEFLKWCDEHRGEKEVMDFSTGQRSISASYAYWLSEIVNVHFKGKEDGLQA